MKPQSPFAALRRVIADPPVAALLLILLLTGVWITFVISGSATPQGSGVQASPKIGSPAPDFTLDTLSGEQLTLSALRGHPVLLNLWASWCLPCRAEMPIIDRVFQRYRQDGLVVIGLNVTSQDSETSARAFADELGLSFPITLDRTGDTSTHYELMGLPSTYFIDRDGIIRNVIIGGPMSEASLLSEVENLFQDH